MSDKTSSGTRRYGFACSKCRRKKIRCDGARPFVGIVQELRNSNKKIQALEQKIKDLTLGICSHTESEGPSKSTPGSHSERTHDKHDEDEDQESALTELSVDESGNVQYFGATSRFYVDSNQYIDQDRAEIVSEPGSIQTEHIEHEKWLRSSSILSKSWEKLAFANIDPNSDVGPQLAEDLLQIYWIWQHPLHNCVYRPCFTRDMALGGPYCSELLLYTLYAHASRHADPSDPRFQHLDRGERLLAKAKRLLHHEMQQSRLKILTIQALLILGGRQCAVGKRSEGWLYTGMANRMMKDIGLHLNPKRLAHLERLTPEDIEVRKRLYLAAYAFDKSISVCLGGPPCLTEMPYSPDSLIDRSDNEEIWTPSFLPSQNTYPPTESLNTETFINFCNLAQLINETYDTVYSERAGRDILSRRIVDLEDRIRQFYKSLPNDLRLEDISLKQCCPPPHIFSLNILYHVALILLYRPFLFLPAISTSQNDDLYTRAHRVGVDETKKINEFLKAHHRTFNFKIQTYLVSYCVYTAATIDVWEVKNPDVIVSAAAAERLAVTLKMLDSEARQTPGIKRSIDIIRRRLSTNTNTINNTNPNVARNHYVEAQQIATPRQHLLIPTHLPNTQIINDSRNFNDTHSQYTSQLQSVSILSQGNMELSLPTSSDMSGPNLCLEPGIWNASGGFVPSSLNWSLQDMDENMNFDVSAFWSPTI